MLARTMQTCRLPLHVRRPGASRFALMGLALGLAGCEDSEKCKWPLACGLVPAEQPSLIIAPSGAVVADGVSPVRLIVTVLGGDVQTGSVVALTSSAGTFTRNDKAAISVALGFGRTDTLYLKPPRDSQTVLVRAGFGLIATSSTIVFSRARPDEILLAPSGGVVVDRTGTQVLALVVSLRRAVGLPSPGARVTFSDGNSGGIFTTAPLSTAEGVVTVNYLPGPAESSVAGPRTLRACTTGSVSEICATLPITVR